MGRVPVPDPGKPVKLPEIKATTRNDFPGRKFFLEMSKFVLGNEFIPDKFKEDN